MRQNCVHAICYFRSLFLVYHNLIHNFINKIKFFINNFFFITTVHYFRQIQRIFCTNLTILLKLLNCQPAIIFQSGILLLQSLNNTVDLVFDQITVDHYILLMMIMTMTGSLTPVMVVNQRSLRLQITMMGSGMNQDAHAGFFSRRNWNNRYAKHFRQPMQIYLHATFLNDIHHHQLCGHRSPFGVAHVCAGQP